MIRGESERREIGQLPSPVGHLRFQDLVLQPFSLPKRVVGILDGQRWQCRHFSACISLVEGRHFTHEHTH